MAFLELRASSRLLRASKQDLAAGTRAIPERIVLDVAPGHPPSDKPPVRIFLGTQPEQHRPERVFVWSIEQVRDPSRVYEIFLMKSLKGFDQRGWTTGFTNYRFAIPHFAGNQGRAIYNDVDQIYLADPGELFDTPMDGHGFLAIAKKESSVMLIDCARMASVWPLADTQRLRKGRLLAKALAQPDGWGPLAPEWNVRDEDEYDPQRAKCVHFTTLHTQPWRPTPARFVYLSHPIGELWYRLEDAANEAGYQVFTADRPSAPYRALLARSGRGEADHGPADWPDEAVRELRVLIETTGAASLLHYSLGGATPAGAVTEAPGVSVTRYDAAAPGASLDPDARYDGVILDIAIPDLPTDDVPWIVSRLFRHARSFVFARLDGGRSAIRTQTRGHAQDIDWWQGMFRSEGTRHTRGIRWKLVLSVRSMFGSENAVREGGHTYSGEPRVWLLTDARPGNRIQGQGLARALGWDYVDKPLEFNALAGVPNRVLGATRRTLRDGDGAALHGPWPDLVIAAGRRTAPVARWIEKQSRGTVRTVFVGDAGGEAADEFDIVVTPRHARLWPHPHRIEMLIPPHAVDVTELAAARTRWPDPFHGLSRPWVGLFLGWNTTQRGIDLETAHRLGEDVGRFAAQQGGHVVALTGPETGVPVTQALDAALGPGGTVRAGLSEGADDYLGYLAHADILVVSGESSAMVGPAAATGKPLYLYPSGGQAPGMLDRIGDWIHERARSRPPNKRGTTRPQQGLEYVCARLVAGGFVRPSPDLAARHQALIDSGVAVPFGQPSPDKTPEPPRETERIATRLKLLLANPKTL